MSKIVRFRKVCQHYGVEICRQWRAILARYKTLDEVLAMVQADPGGYLDWGDQGALTNVWQVRYILWALSVRTDVPKRLHFSNPNTQPPSSPLSAAEIRRAKKVLEHLSDRAGLTEVLDE